jgi:hypothetical protein
VIQSAAAGIDDQAPSEPCDEEDDDGPDDDRPEPDPSPADDDDDADPFESAPEPDPDADLASFDSDDPSEPLEPDDALVPAPDPPRSFFAQPDPLKWIVGGANSLRIVPSSPHDGQNSGPGSLRPWRMSVRWSHAVQAYS